MIFEGIHGWIPHEPVEEQSIVAMERGCVLQTSRSALKVSFTN
jgi:hypothetical protein